jgi:hypothetical protein
VKLSKLRGNQFYRAPLAFDWWLAGAIVMRPA